MVSNPEFLKEGAAVADFMKPDRIIVGTDSPRAAELLRQLYEPFSRSHDKLIVMDVRSAELTKYAANVMLATKISLMNELANIAERYGADIEQVRVGIGSDPRIGYSFIYPGCGYGGSCFPEGCPRADPLGRGDRLRRRTGAGRGQRQQPAEAHPVPEDHGPFRRPAAGPDALPSGAWLSSPTPTTCARRRACVLMEALWAAGARVRAYDPQAMAETARMCGARPDLTLCESADEALKGADALVIVTEWQEFRSPDFDTDPARR